MQDNLLFHNVEEKARENTTNKIFLLLEENQKRDTQHKPHAIFVNLTSIRIVTLSEKNAKKLKGTKIGISEQFPEVIEKIRQTLYPEMRKAKAQGHQVR